MYILPKDQLRKGSKILCELLLLYNKQWLHKYIVVLMIFWVRSLKTNKVKY